MMAWLILSLCCGSLLFAVLHHCSQIKRRRQRCICVQHVSEKWSGFNKSESTLKKKKKKKQKTGLAKFVSKKG
jgi:hypothetical protein